MYMSKTTKHINYKIFILALVPACICFTACESKEDRLSRELRESTIRVQELEKNYERAVDDLDSFNRDVESYRELQRALENAR